MKHLPFYIFLISLCLWTACDKDGNQTDDLNDYIEQFNLKNDGAIMPVIVQGNVASDVFVLWLHGGPGGESTVYNDLITDVSDPLEERCAMVYWDQRGSGAAGGNYDKDDLTIDQYVEDLEKLVELLHLKYGEDIQLFLMGHSWGGMLGSAYLVEDDNQTNIKGWIDVDGAHNWPLGIQEVIDMFEYYAPVQIEAGNSKNFWEEVLEYIDNLDRNNLSKKEQMTLNRYGHQAGVKMTSDKVILAGSLGIDDLLDYTFDSPVDPIAMIANTFFVQNGMIDEFLETSFSEELTKVTIPSLFLWGAYDFVVPPGLGVDAYENIGSTDKEIIYFDRSGHSPMLSESDLFVKTITTFVDRIAD